MSKFKYSKFIGVTLLLPLFSSAQALGGTTSFFEQSLDLIQRILIPIVFTLALLYFFWGVVKYIKSEGDGKAEGRQIMIWGVVALFVMSSIWALVSFISNETGLADYAFPGNEILIPGIRQSL